MSDERQGVYMWKHINTFLQYTSVMISNWNCSLRHRTL